MHHYSLTQTDTILLDLRIPIAILFMFLLCLFHLHSYTLLFVFVLYGFDEMRTNSPEGTDVTGIVISYKIIKAPNCDNTSHNKEYAYME